MGRTLRTSRNEGNLPALLLVHEVAIALRCSDDTVRRRVADGSIAAVKLAGITRIPVAELDRVLAQANQPRIVE